MTKPCSVAPDNTVNHTVQGPVVQSIVSLTSLLVVKMWTVLVSTISNSKVFLLKKMWVAFKATHIYFSKNIRVYAIFNDQGFNDTLANNILSFEQLGPDFFLVTSPKHMLWIAIRNEVHLIPQHMFSWRNKTNMWIPILSKACLCWGITAQSTQFSLSNHTFTGQA